MRRLFAGLAIASVVALTPAWALADDQQIADQIVEQLQSQKAAGELTGFGIDLEVDNGTVWLKGHVSSAEQQRMVLELAGNVDGVEKVVNDLDIKGDEPSKPSLLDKAKHLVAPANLFKLGNDDEAAATQQASLSEMVDTTPVAQTNARPSASDQEIAETIIGKLRQQKDQGNLRGFAIDINVDRGSVWVKGHVANVDQRTLVLEIARRVRGVTQVVNDISIHSTGIQAHPVAAAGQLQQQAPAQLQPAPTGSGVPMAFAPSYSAQADAAYGQPMPIHAASGIARARHDHPQMPGYAWPSYAAYPNYGAVTYPKQYSAQAWPYIGPFYPYPQVPLGWRKVTLEWDDGWWMLDFKSK